MIKANELRIGNWVMYDGKPYKMHEICEEFPILKTDEYGVCATSWSKCDPIQLTPERLDMCGFMEHGVGEYNHIDSSGNYGKFYLSYITTEENFQVEYRIAGIDIWKLIDVKYLHQLQNLYFALTGEELTVNL